MAQHMPMDEDYVGRFSLGLWRQVLGHTRPFRHWIAMLAGVAVIIAACDASFALVTRALIDAAVKGQTDRLWPLGLQYAGLTVLICLCVLAFILLAEWIATGLVHNIRRDAFAKLQSLDLAYFDQRPVGWLISRVTTDCNRLAGVVAWGILDATWACTLMASVAGIMFYLNWRLALVVLAVVPALLAVSWFFQRLMLDSSRAVRKTNSQITASYNELIAGVRTTQTLVREHAAMGEFQDLSERMFSQSVRNAVQSALYLPILLTLGSVATGLALWVGGLDTLAGGMSLGTLVAFMTYTGQFFDPMHVLASRFVEIQRASAAAERVMSLLAEEPRIRDLAAAPADPPAPGVACDGLPDRITHIAFQHVDFAYAKGGPVLTDFNLEVGPGQCLALVGPTGGGKSTIVSLLCRFYEPTAGQILLDGVDYRQRSLRWLQGSLGVVLQTPHLFSGTIRENIRYGRLDASDAEVEHAAKLVCADEFIRTMDKGYDSPVGEGGVSLSTGQKQLITFARAILAQPKILVMDEATSSIDTHTEQLIQQGMETLMRGRISFVIAHRLSTIRKADRILVIEGGRIAESGTHRDLLRQGGHYYDLYTTQFRHEREAAVLEAAEA